MRCEQKQTGYRVNILTTASRTGKEAFISRMFAPLDGIHEGVYFVLRLPTLFQGLSQI